MLRKTQASIAISRLLMLYNGQINLMIIAKMSYDSENWFCSSFIRQQSTILEQIKALVIYHF